MNHSLLNVTSSKNIASSTSITFSMNDCISRSLILPILLSPSTITSFTFTGKGRLKYAGVSRLLTISFVVFIGPLRRFTSIHLFTWIFKSIYDVNHNYIAMKIACVTIYLFNSDNKNLSSQIFFFYLSHPFPQFSTSKLFSRKLSRRIASLRNRCCAKPTPNRRRYCSNY